MSGTINRSLSGTVLPDNASLEHSDLERTAIFVPCPQRQVPCEMQIETSMNPPENCRNYMMWIDGVGAWQLAVGTTFVLGAESSEEKAADISFLANISRRHATLSLRGRDWLLSPHQSTTVCGKTAESMVLLRSGDSICLAKRVQLGFRVPSELSSSAVLDFESDHRPTHSVDGIILMTDHCLLGPRRDDHVYCSDWPDRVILFQKSGKLMCRSRSPVAVDGKAIRDSTTLEHGNVVSGENIRFRIEEI